MIKLKPILFIDDGLIHNEIHRVKSLESICTPYSDKVLFDVKVEPYIDFLDYSGNDCKLLFDNNITKRLFIHHSYNAPTLMPSNAEALLHVNFQGKVFFFSGDASGTAIKKRDKVYGRFLKYLELLNDFDEYIDYCFDDDLFLGRFAKDLIEQIPDNDNAFKRSESYLKLVKLLNNELGNIELPNNSDYFDTIETLRNYIDQL